MIVAEDTVIVNSFGVCEGYDDRLKEGYPAVRGILIGVAMGVVNRRTLSLSLLSCNARNLL